MKTADLLIAANTIWVVKHGGTHGSPMSPLLLGVPSQNRNEAALGQSPAPPSNVNVLRTGGADV